MNSDNCNELIEDFIHKYGEKKLAQYLEEQLSNFDNVLTIVGNKGSHKIPEEYLHGEVYAVSSGNLDLSSKESTVAEYRDVLTNLIEKLKERPWSKVYFIPTGPTTLVLQIKIIVYNVLRISTIDLFYSKGEYFELSFDYRELSGSHENS